MQSPALEGGFPDPARDAAIAFRAVMEAIARPGTLQRLTGATPPAPLSPAAGALLLTLCDTETPIHLAGDYDCDAIRTWLAFHTGAPLVGPSACSFALGTWEALMPLSQYRIGTAQYPDRSATLIVEMEALAPEGSQLSGPGIKHRAALSLPDPQALVANAQAFPLGLDFFFTCGDQVAGLPRSTKIHLEEAL
ncbi:phosphonate C-P lyase system protein PhnH [Pseudoruegeria sp. SHC-113]|uniref:phosphonate C-P lyase system protein PhnH n=1 Tax=Pseudoruegeria sp. SHC-113 TaxID=2855439 RepID=UPI0021BB386F|nr:phosphonate C-P lyase system protein PhnH [Pseudoruegeria sp. SHC-113]MCT8160204.1 phosphonate C-P lyase system protein PhnH [Pseudoruegeria sp. SHC-113]